VTRLPPWIATVLVALACLAVIGAVMGLVVASDWLPEGQ
jgi:ribose/xylose/arabinose/galactoside ABC-type transport system permease subunit